ncbi:MAG: phosphatase PAP2 family protein [Sulfurimonas sp.]|nr:phosphatase PAP2 family protein [Sulfurimonas sp.]
MKKLFTTSASSLVVASSLMAGSTTGTTEDILQVLIPLTAYGTTLYLDDEEGQTQFYKSFGTNLAVTYGLKFAVDKKRPNGGNNSFPSGHTSAAFQGASFIHFRYGLKYSIPAYLAAAYVGYSRVATDAHYTTDVVVGALIGGLSSYYFTTEYKGYEIKPMAVNSGLGFSISKTW